MSVAERGEKTPGPITLDQLLALNEEIAALVRGGLPLGGGLLETGRDVRGRLGRIAAVLGRRMNRGEGLAEALEAERAAIPPLYRAVVEAGARAGRLPTALEGMARYIRAVAEARRSIGLAVWYPGLVLAMAYALFVLMLALVVPRLMEAFVSLDIPIPGPLRLLGSLHGTEAYWWPIGPILVALLMAAWFRSGTTAGMKSGSWGGLRRFPWMGRLLADYEAANFADLLALLLEHRVPYPSAMVLAAEAAAAPRLADGARRFAEAIGRGAPARSAIDAAGPDAFPPMLRWTLAAEQSQGSLVDALRHLAGLYRRSAQYRAEKIAILLPLFLTVAVGVVAVSVYAISLFLPLIEILKGLSVA